MKRNSNRRDYSKYIWQGSELAETLLLCFAIVIGLAYFFYRSIYAVIPLSAVGYFCFRIIQKNKQEQYLTMLVEQFRECMLSVSAAMKAGYAVENAFLESREDMRILYGEESAIFQELEWIRRGLVINITLEEQLQDLAERSGSDEIIQFADVFCIAKRNSGNLADIMETSAKMIGQRMDTASEIRTLLSGKRMEQNVMKVMPFLVMVYIGVSYPGYFDVLYHNWLGALIMSGCLLIYLVAYVLGERTLQKIAEEIS